MRFNHHLPRKKADLFNHISNKTEGRIQESLAKIYAQHEIDPSSKLGILLKNGIYKIIGGMHHMHDAVKNLNSELDDDHKLSSKASIKRLFYNDFLKACTVPTNSSQSFETKERILSIEIGRTKVVSKLLRKIQEHSGQELHNSFKILGSLIRQCLDIYKELGHAELNFSKNPPAHQQQVAKMLADHRKTGEIRYEAA